MAHAFGATWWGLHLDSKHDALVPHRGYHVPKHLLGAS